MISDEIIDKSRIQNVGLLVKWKISKYLHFINRKNLMLQMK